MREEYAEIRHSGGQPGTDKLLEPPSSKSSACMCSKACSNAW